jgi:glycosyltransferase involved in cell wall biosynthesis
VNAVASSGLVPTLARATTCRALGVQSPLATRVRATRDNRARNRYPPRTSLHVTHVVATLELGGAERFCVDLALALQQCGVRSSLCAMYRGGDLVAATAERALPTHVIHRHVKHDPVAFARLVGFLRRERPDVVHVHDVAGVIRGAPAARLAGVRAVVAVRHDERSVGWARDLLLGSAERLVDRAVASSAAVRRHIAARRSDAHHEVIPCGVDLQRFLYRDPPVRVPFRLLSIGRLEEQKGHVFLIDALPHVQRRFPGTVLTIVGNGPLLSRLRARARELGIASSVELVPPDPDTAALLDRADLFCFPSLWEAQGLAMIEAQAVGVPVVASAVGGIGEHVQDEVSGRLVPPGDARALADAIVRTLGAHEERVRLARAARRSAEALDIQAIAQRWLGVYAQASEHSAARTRTQGVG